MTRRQFTLASVGGAAAIEGKAGSKAPFKVLYSNDTTNILSCVSPFHKKGENFRPGMLEATVDEAAGADVHMLQPGLGWIPWWKSKEYPADKHYREFFERTGHDPGSWGRYMMNGGDLVKVFVDRCRRNGVAPFVSLRLNDGHHTRNLDAKDGKAASVSRFYADHPEWRIGRDTKDWAQGVQNWAIPEVRNHKLAFIREICEGYDIDGFELDFMRHSSLFRLEETTFAQRAAIVAGFIGEVRKALDRTAKNGKRRWLCARVPCVLSGLDRLGIDLAAATAAGLDMVNVSVHYCTQQQTDFARIRKLAPNAAVYFEMTHCTYRGASIPGFGDSFPFLRTTDEQFYTTAHHAYQRGADGLSLFNFVYFREHGTPGRGPFREPPFHILKRLGDPKWLAGQRQWWFLSKVDNVPPATRPLPKKFAPGDSHAFSLDLAPARKDGQPLFRLRTVEDSSAGRWKAVWNGAALEPAPYVAKPIDHPYDAALGQPAQYACFRCPPAAIRNGENKVVISLADGGPVTLDYLDLIL